MKIEKVLWGLLFIFFLLFGYPIYSKAAEINEDTIEIEVSDYLNIHKLEREWKELFPTISINIEKVFAYLFEGKVLKAITYIGETIFTGWKQQLLGYQHILIKLLLLGILSAVTANFVMIFDNHQVADICQYFFYLLLSLFLIEIFKEAYVLAAETIEQITLFVKLFLPAYMITVASAGGIATGTAFYQWVLLVLYGEEEVLKNGLIKVVEGYLYIGMLGGIWMEERLKFLVALCKKSVEFILKCMIGIVSGVGMLQTMITSVIDSNRWTLFQHTLSVIPGAGAIAEGMTKLFAGSILLIKNSTGILLLLLLLLVAAYPGIKLILITALLKGAAALISLLGNREIATCTDHAGNAVFLLFRIVITALVLLIALIAISLYSIRG